MLSQCFRLRFFRLEIPHFSTNKIPNKFLSHKIFVYFQELKTKKKKTVLFLVPKNPRSIKNKSKKKIFSHWLRSRSYSFNTKFPTDCILRKFFSQIFIRTISFDRERRRNGEIFIPILAQVGRVCVCRCDGTLHLSDKLRIE